jgi:hypothetical protein
MAGWGSRAARDRCGHEGVSVARRGNTKKGGLTRLSSEAGRLYSRETGAGKNDF